LRVNCDMIRDSTILTWDLTHDSELVIHDLTRVTTPQDSELDSRLIPCDLQLGSELRINDPAEKPNINTFKNRFDINWCMQDVLNYYESELSGIRNLSLDSRDTWPYVGCTLYSH